MATTRTGTGAANEDSGSGRGVRGLRTACYATVVIAGLKLAAEVIVPVVVAAFLAIICLPMVHWLQRKRVPTALAVVLVLVLVLALVVAILVMVVDQLSEFHGKIPEYGDRLETYADEFRGWLESKGIDLAPPTERKPLDLRTAISMAGNVAGTAANALSTTFLVLLTMIFMLFEASGMPGKIRRAMGDPHADLTKFEEIVTQIYAYLGIKTALSLLTGALFAAWLAIIGVPYFLLWGFLAFILNFIPNIGSLLAAIPPILVAFLEPSGGVGLAALTGVGNVVINQVLGNIVEPKVMGSRLGLSALVVFLSLIIWGWLWGPVGMLLSVPLTMVLKIMLENSQDFRPLAVMLGPCGDEGAKT